MFSTITTAPSTIMPKSIAPIDSRFAGMCAQSRQMNENSRANGIVTATISAVRTLKRNMPEDDEHQQHAAHQVAFDGLGGLLNQIGAVVVRHDLDIRRQHAPVERLGQLLDFFQNDLRLLADAHQDDAFDGIVLTHVAELSEPRRVADRDGADVFHVDRNAGVRGDDDVADVVERLHQAEAADVVELAALRVEPAARVGVVVGELLRRSAAR